MRAAAGQRWGLQFDTKVVRAVKHQPALLFACLPAPYRSRHGAHCKLSQYIATGTRHATTEVVGAVTAVVAVVAVVAVASLRLPAGDPCQLASAAQRHFDN